MWVFLVVHCCAVLWGDTRPVPILATGSIDDECHGLTALCRRGLLRGVRLCGLLRTCPLDCTPTAAASRQIATRVAFVTALGETVHSVAERAPEMSPRQANRMI